MANNKEQEKLEPLNYEKMIEDLSYIPINESDTLFEVFTTQDRSETDHTKTHDIYDSLEKFVIFKSNMELENHDLKSDFSLNDLNDEFDVLEKRLSILQHFIDVSKKFLSINTK